MGKDSLELPPLTPPLDVVRAAVGSGRELGSGPGTLARRVPRADKLRPRPSRSAVAAPSKGRGGSERSAGAGDGRAPVLVGAALSLGGAPTVGRRAATTGAADAEVAGRGAAVTGDADSGEARTVGDGDESRDSDDVARGTVRTGDGTDVVYDVRVYMVASGAGSAERARKEPTAG